MKIVVMVIIRFLLTFCTMKWAKRYIKIVGLVFPKETLLMGKLAILCPEMTDLHDSGSPPRIF